MSANLPVANLEQFGDLGLRPSMVKRQSEDFPKFDRQFLHRLMELNPAIKFSIGWRGDPKCRGMALVRWCQTRSSAANVGAAGQVEQLPSYLDRSQVEKRPSRVWPHLVKAS